MQRLAQNVKPFAGTERFPEFGHSAQELAPGADPAMIVNSLRPIGIVETQNRRLVEEIGSTEASRMLRIALDLGRPSFMTFDKESDSRAPKWHRGCVH